MWREFARFELRHQLRQPLFVVSAVAFFGLALALASSNVGAAFGDASGKTVRNAPIVVMRFMPVLSLLGLFVITAFVTSAALRDFDLRSDMLIFTKPLRKFDYVSGRFLGAMAVSLLVLVVAVGGLMAANAAPWQPASALGPVAPKAYALGLAVIIVPNLFVMGALFFAMALWSRRWSWTYLGVVFFIGMQDAIELATEHMENRTLGALLEPSGIVALESVARYWTVAEQSTRLPVFGGVLLANRLLWLGVALIVMLVSLGRFDFTLRERRRRSWLLWRRAGVSGSATAATVSIGAMLPHSAGRGARVIARPGVGPVGPRGRRFWRGLWRQTRIEVAEVVPSAPFLTLTAFGLMFVVVYSFLAGMQDGTPSYPMTHLMLRAIEVGVRLTLVVILVFYAGEMVFRQRSLKLSEVYGALPVSNGILVGAKLLALSAVMAVFLGAATLITIVVQGVKGDSSIDLGLYAQGLAIIAWPLLLVLVLAVFLQVVTNHKLLGLLLTALVFLARFALPRLGFEDKLYLFAQHPPVTYSVLNGYGHHAASFLGFMIYWSLAGVMLVAASLLLWPRGREHGLAARWRQARQQLTRPLLATMVIAALGMAATGLWLFDQTHRRMGYTDRHTIAQRLADYETTYRGYRDVALPRVTSVFAEVDLYPHQRAIEIRGRYRLENQGAEPIYTLPVTRSPRWVEGVLPVYGGVLFRNVSLPAHRVEIEDDRLGFYVFELAAPLLPGEAIDFAFTVRVDHQAFGNNRHNNLIVGNGTFFSNREFFPFVGYARGNELWTSADRQRLGLPPVERAMDLDDAGGRQRNYLDADWAQFEAIVSTDADQTALAPGKLERTWEDGGRRYFHYKTTTPINLFAFLSGRYAVARDRWNDVEIEVYYDPDHAFNIDHFIEVTRRSLAYMTEHFGPYGRDQLRIAEIPSYHGPIAFAFAETIAVSESWCFGLNLEDAELDWLAGILAHEVAHQWWNHQVVPADVQGATLIGESLAQYAAMMILDDMYGPGTVRYFLKFHLDRYLALRGSEETEELPLARVENQAYIHYSKASLALYALVDIVGEDSVNQALRSFFAQFHFQGPPYPSTRDLLTHLRTAVPPEHHGLIEDLFETILVFDNRVVNASVAEQGNGTFQVTLETATRKQRDDGHGVMQDVALDDWVDVGVFGERRVNDVVEEVVLVLEKRHLRSEKGTFSFVVDQRPVRVGIDPYNKLVDRDANDNVRRLEAPRPATADRP